MNEVMPHSRRTFLGSTARLAAAGAALSISGGLLPARAATTIDARDYLLNWVRLEEGFEHQGGVLTGTRSGLYQLRITEGRISEIRLQSEVRTAAGSLPAFDAGGRLLLPAMRDMHIHLDKTFYGGPWEAPRRGKNIVEMIRIEERLLPRLLPTSQGRAEKLIGLLQSHGSTMARSHCNVDPVSGLKSLEHLQFALEKHRAGFDCEIVAFPQHGLLRSKVEPLMREAMRMGARHVGGLDPSTVDGDMKKSLDLMFRIALDHDAGVDIHLHEPAPSGIAAIDHILQQVEAKPSLRGKVTISHAFALASLDAPALDRMAARLAEQQIAIATTVPLGNWTMPLPALIERGVVVMPGTDSVTDHWSPFGRADMLEKANLFAQLYGHDDEFRLSRALGLVTGGLTPLDPQGARTWPRIGDLANGVLLRASCSAEAVARLPARDVVLHRGRLVHGELPSP